MEQSINANELEEGNIFYFPENIRENASIWDRHFERRQWDVQMQALVRSQPWMVFEGHCHQR